MIGQSKAWRHLTYILIGILIVLTLQSLGALVLPTALDTAELQSSLTPTPTVQATPDAAPSATSSAIPVSTPMTQPTPTPASVTSQWPKPVSSPLSFEAVVNKKYVLSSSFVPPDLRTVNVPHTNNHPLRSVAAAALEQMVTDAQSSGVQLRLLSGYRSYATQKGLYTNYVAKYGQAEADTFSARPGHSEHQLGLTLDIGDVNAPQCDIVGCFATTAGGHWVATHAAAYGYIIRYTTAKQAITGYMAEPWHIRYVGVALAQQLKASGLTLEEHFNLPGGGY